MLEKYQIYWDDLTPMAQERLEPIKPDNDDFPIAIVEIEKEGAQ